MRADNLAAALSRLRDFGHEFQMENGAVDPASKGFLTATASIDEHLRKMGRWNSLNQIERTARAVLGYEFDQVLYGRNPTNEARAPSLPFGFLRQLAVRLPDLPAGDFDPQVEFTAAFELARDVVTLTDVESYGQFWFLGAQRADLGAWLAKATLHDHLFAQQQWTPYLTPILLRGFFGFVHDERLRSRLGWGIADIVTAVEVILENVRSSPGLISRETLEKKLPTDTVGALLRDFVHFSPAPNEHYNSPFAARSADLMFRPLLTAILPGTFIVPSASAMGPALYESVATAVRTVLSPNEVKKITGEGLEKALGTLLRFREIEPTVEGRNYSAGRTAGECDIVIEDEKTIIFLECKAKPLTRAAMAGIQEDAILAYLQGVVAGQAQALQHETVLLRDRNIRFDNGYVLEMKGRDILRLSVTLHDHGTLQDRFLFSQLSAVLATSELTGRLEDPSVRERIKKPNEILRRLRQNLTADLGDAGDVDRVWKRARPTASLSIGHIAAFLVERNTVSGLAEALRKPATFATGSVLKEYHFLRTQGLL